MAGRRQTAFIAVLVLAARVFPAEAQSVPLPPPAPIPKTGTGAGAGTVPPPPSSIPAKPEKTDKTENTDSGILNWFTSPFSSGQPAAPENKTTVALDPTQKALADKVSAYLSSMQVLSGEFVQIGPDGRQSKGVFYIQKPGKVRFEYDPPNPTEVIADGSAVVVRDRKLNTKDLFTLSQTPLRYLLQDKIDLIKDTSVVRVTADAQFVSVTVEEKQVLIGTSRLMMMFDAKTLELRQWVITDPQGYETAVAVSNLDRTRRPDPSLFKIDYTQYPQ
jgi:outer membrane lipoprotein-sorting protein